MNPVISCLYGEINAVEQNIPFGGDPVILRSDRDRSSRENDAPVRRDSFVVRLNADTAAENADAVPDRDSLVCCHG